MRMDMNKTVKDIVAEVPASTRIFKRMGIDCCYGGEKALQDACNDASVPVEEVLRLLEGAEDMEAAKSLPVDGNRDAPANILAVISETSERQTVCRILDEAGQKAIFASTIHEARDVLLYKPMHLVICSAQLQDGTFRELLSLIPKPFEGMVILCSGSCPSGVRIDALDLGILDYVSYPLQPEEVQWVIRGALVRSLERKAGIAPAQGHSRSGN
jgi:PleD family two-component response regulator